MDDLISRQDAIDAVAKLLAERCDGNTMGREEKVCKEVDAECRDCREPYEDSLVHVCKEIRRKVKGALWT